ncbi:MAG: hypothetical protein ACI4Q4_03320 [Oscillospiraceae bacterium]
MEKAKIFVASKNGKMINPELYMDVMFNPETYSVDSGAEYSSSAAPGRFEDGLQFTKLSTRRLSLELLFDTMNRPSRFSDDITISSQLKDVFADSSPDVSEYVNKLHKLIETEKSGNEVFPPPVVVFAWGSFSFQGVIESFKESYTMFQRDGSPIKATVSLSIKEYNSDLAMMAATATINKSLLDSQNLEDDVAKAEALLKTIVH